MSSAGLPEIGLVAVGDVDPTHLGWLRAGLPTVFPTGVSVLSPLPLPARYYSVERRQYLADGILAEIACIPRGSDVLPLGITSADLYSPGLNFVFGIACRQNALVSTFRLDPEFYGMHDREGLFRRRLLTEAVHELGHAMGLPHCEHPACAMYFSNWIGDTDLKGPGLCFRCARILGIAPGKSLAGNGSTR
ncbi:MAG: archaemetzincin family Zn-dependent metalloprotease [Methanolinea sp.]|nr:archaemetzincin family Zn-dependent metalloprotease [Methanolinea sp.]